MKKFLESLLIATVVGSIFAAGASAAPPALNAPNEGDHFQPGTVTFEAQTTSNASAAHMDFYVSMSNVTDPDGRFSTLEDAFRAGPTSDIPPLFVWNPNATDTWSTTPGTYWWQAVQDCTGGAVDCVAASPPQSFVVDPPSPPPPLGLPPLASQASTAATAPQTYLKKRPRHRTRKRKVKFRFNSNVPGASFQCLFAQGWSDCDSPHVFRRLVPGRYQFMARAIVNGVQDPTPVKWVFRILPPRD